MKLSKLSRGRNQQQPTRVFSLLVLKLSMRLIVPQQGNNNLRATGAKSRKSHGSLRCWPNKCPLMMAPAALPVIVRDETSRDEDIKLLLMSHLRAVFECGHKN